MFKLIITTLISIIHYNHKLLESQWHSSYRCECSVYDLKPTHLVINIIFGHQYVIAIVKSPLRTGGHVLVATSGVNPICNDKEKHSYLISYISLSKANHNQGAWRSVWLLGATCQLFARFYLLKWIFEEIFSRQVNLDVSWQRIWLKSKADPDITDHFNHRCRQSGSHKTPINYGYNPHRIWLPLTMDTIRRTIKLH